MTTNTPKNDTSSGQWISATDLPVCASPDKVAVDKSDINSLIARAEAHEKQASAAANDARLTLCLQG